jgi:hypothetical protein
MDSNQAQLLYQRLGEHIPNPGNMRRVFQILLNRPERPLWMSWPPDGSTDGPTSHNFAKLAEEVRIDNTVHGSDAKTSCTRLCNQYIWDPKATSILKVFLFHMVRLDLSESLGQLLIYD